MGKRALPVGQKNVGKNISLAPKEWERVDYAAGEKAARTGKPVNRSAEVLALIHGRDNLGAQIGTRLNRQLLAINRLHVIARQIRGPQGADCESVAHELDATLDEMMHLLLNGNGNGNGGKKRVADRAVAA